MVQDMGVMLVKAMHIKKMVDLRKSVRNYSHWKIIVMQIL